MTVNVNNIHLFYKKSGQGPPLLLLHGNGEDHHIFDAISSKLERDFTLYALDSRNHGQSEMTTDFSYETMAGDVYEFLRALDLKAPGIVGFSDGAITALLLGIKHGEAVGRLALLGVNLRPEDFTEKSYRWVKKTYEETKDPLFKMMLEQPNIELDDLRGVGNPTLVIAGENDIYRPELFGEVAAALPGGELKIMMGHGHDSYINGQDILYPDIKAFFGVYSKGKK